MEGFPGSTWPLERAKDSDEDISFAIPALPSSNASVGSDNSLETMSVPRRKRKPLRRRLKKNISNSEDRAYAYAKIKNRRSQDRALRRRRNTNGRTRRKEQRRMRSSSEPTTKTTMHPLLLIDDNDVESSDHTSSGSCSFSSAHGSLHSFLSSRCGESSDKLDSRTIQ